MLVFLSASSCRMYTPRSKTSSWILFDHQEHAGDPPAFRYIAHVTRDPQDHAWVCMRHYWIIVWRLQSISAGQWLMMLNDDDKSQAIDYGQWWLEATNDVPLWLILFGYWWLYHQTWRTLPPWCGDAHHSAAPSVPPFFEPWTAVPQREFSGRWTLNGKNHVATIFVLGKWSCLQLMVILGVYLCFYVCTYIHIHTFRSTSWVSFCLPPNYVSF